ncbi:MAG: hypothetical protein A3J59_01170 [Candidatus Buchananbacteria bacterium RIFCSPHIGHO2_02_FULL_56_16]|uniref:Peptidase C39-like domain-containing protein n=1 Tax=Candidatus Buchananbacteria bacterium RIFCSPHIGHO2_02_FULL_56_16 TaxID=1797542 RepID=A0A1G1YDM8_9BACT|nr:MAG: hypothetical protein A3J59_01170 [Candidatus Buchananbacteria bacterium RIFCSPHIGHO2_02_FULL_56_16]
MSACQLQPSEPAVTSNPTHNEPVPNVTDASTTSPAQAPTDATATTPAEGIGQDTPKPPAIVAPTWTPSAEPTSTDQVPAALPSTLDYPVPFTSQAPYTVWDDLHQEACEEASMIMADAFFNDRALTAHSAEQALLNLVKWETDQGYLVDVTAAEAAQIMVDYFGLSAEVVTEVTVDRIKTELNKGKLVIVPAAGRELGNPNFRRPGPIYHMLVIRGYDGTRFITNDPGTRKGEKYTYAYDTLLSAIHDWDHDRARGGMTNEEIAQGRKVMIVVGQ